MIGTPNPSVVEFMRRIFLISYAGGSSLAYRTWPQMLPECNASLAPLELPGHGRRADEALCSNVPELVSDLISQIRNAASQGDFLIFGHSFGALLAYEVAVAVQDFGLPPARALIISGANPPHRLKLKMRHQLSNEEFLAYVKRYGGVDERLMKDSVAMAFFIKMLRADYQALECHDWRFKVKVSAPISVICSEDDLAVERAFLDEWSQYTENRMSLTSLGNEGHLYLSTKRDQLIEVLSKACVDTCT
jgi:medium-chain acyl-[acyl-carrier-protein] hydrolase